MKQPEQPPRQQSIKGIFKSIEIMYFALFAGAVLNLGAIIFIFKSDKLSTLLDNMELGIPSMISIGVAVIALFASNYFYQMRIKNAKGNLREKLGFYLQAFLMKFSFIIMSALFSIALFFLFDEAICVAVAVVVLAYYLSQRPNKQKISETLHLSLSEQNEIRQ